MYVYLRFEKSVKRLPEVSLLHCYKAKVGTFIETRIEPALWYKVMVIDSLLVDCESRTVNINYFSTKQSEVLHGCEPELIKPQEVIQFFRNQEPIFTECGYYDFDPTVDELFDTARNIFLHLGLDTFDKEGNTSTYEELLRLLHVFILPEIKFGTEQRQIVADVLSEIEKQHEEIEDLIQKKDKTKRNTENSLSRQRLNLLLTEKFNSQKYVSSLDDKFLKIFLQHLEKDIKKQNEILLTHDRVVQEFRNSETEKGKLETARSERTEIYEALERSMTAREEIKNVISRSHVKKKFKKSRENMADFHELYVEVTKRLDAVNAEIRDLITSKIKISSVREAALLTVKEIDSDGISYGYNRKKGSFESETDLFDPSKKPDEWASLSERVRTYLHVKQLGFRLQFEKFCEQMKRKCQQLYDESKLFSISGHGAMEDSPLSPDAIKFIDTTGLEAVERRSKVNPLAFRSHTQGKEKAPKLSVSHRGYSTRWSVGTVSKHECEAICKAISNHISDMAQMLAVEILKGDTINRGFQNKLYVCYEEHVSTEIMPVLCELYEKSYRDQINSLANWLVRYASAEFSFQEKTITGLFQASPGSSEKSSGEWSTDETMVKVVPESSQTDTLGSSISLENMPFDELYQKFNKQNENVPNSFEGIFDKDCNEFLALQNVEGCDDKHFSAVDDASQKLESVHVNGISDMSDSSVQGATGGLDVGHTVQERRHLSMFEDTKPPDYDEVVMRKRPKTQPVFDRQTSAPPPYTSLLTQKERFFKYFEEFFNLVRKEDEEMTLFRKLRHLTHISKYVENQITALRAENGVKAVTCTDDILDVLILLLCKLDAKLLLKLYAHLNLMIHLSPPFMQGNAHDYSLVNMSVAFQHLFEQQVLHKSSLEND